MASLTRWWLIRHAPPPSWFKGTLIGHSDIPADTAFAPAPFKTRLPSDALWLVSPLRRSQQTAQMLGAPAWRVIPEFIEQNHGHWEGRRWADLLASEPAAKAYLESYQHTRPPGGECLEDVRVRCLKAFKQLSAEHQGRSIIAVIHAGPIRCLLADALDMPLSSALKLSIDPLSISCLEGFECSWQISGVNWTPAG